MNAHNYVHTVKEELALNQKKNKKNNAHEITITHKKSDEEVTKKKLKSYFSVIHFTRETLRCYDHRVLFPNASFSLTFCSSHALNSISSELNPSQLLLLWSRLLLLVVAVLKSYTPHFVRVLLAKYSKRKQKYVCYFDDFHHLMSFFKRLGNASIFYTLRTNQMKMTAAT